MVWKNLLEPVTTSSLLQVLVDPGHWIGPGKGARMSAVALVLIMPPLPGLDLPKYRKRMDSSMQGVLSQTTNRQMLWKGFSCF